MRILHILGTPRAEGTPNLVLDWLSTGLHQQEVYVLHKDPPDLTERLKSSAAWYGEASHLDLAKRKFPSIAAGVRAVCLERKPDLVICWTTGFGNWACLGARLAGIKRLIVHCGNPPNRGFKADWITRYVMWPLFALGAKCVCCSNYVRDEFRAIPLLSPSMFSSVYNCAKITAVAARAEASRLKENRSQELIGIMVATMESHKDHRTLLHALPAILRDLPDFRIRFVGDGSLRPELETLADNLNVAQAVEFLGTRRDVPELLGQADVFIFSTTPQEGLGTVLIEALAAGLPVIASAVPACIEALDGGRLGKMVIPGSPDSIAAGIIDVLTENKHDPSPGGKWAASFTPEQMIASYLRIANLG